ncbi:hypothetical protein DFQ26_001288, partial [Actinomortierella ambigua]
RRGTKIVTGDFKSTASSHGRIVLKVTVTIYAIVVAINVLASSGTACEINCINAFIVSKMAFTVKSCSEADEKCNQH